MLRPSGSVIVALFIVGASCAFVGAQSPDHPIITEIFNNPPGASDGPTDRDPTNAHQEFIEIYLPTLADLNPVLNKDALNITYFEIEGDSGNSHVGEVNQRFDLPTFDLDASNGLTGLERPSSGVIVLGWVDYDLFNPPVDLAGTPSTRIGLINNGITAAPAGVMFIAFNGAFGTGTTNFPIPIAESRIDIPNENVSGIAKNGSNVYLLVNRDDTGYVPLEDHSTGFASFADLSGGMVLGLTSLLDGVAGNDDINFIESLQPFAVDTGIDLADVLPDLGVFTPWVAQIAEASGSGYARRFVDSIRSTEDAIVGNEDPAADAGAQYRNVYRSGPFFATPGKVVFTTSAPELSVPFSNRLGFNVIANTTGHPAMLCANVGGNYPIDITVMPGVSSDPGITTFTPSDAAIAVPGQSSAFPLIEVSVSPSAPNGAIVSAPVTFVAGNSVGGDPAVLNPNLGSTTVATILNPTRAIDSSGAPIETTVLVAVQGFGADPAVANEFLASDLASFISANLGNSVGSALGNIGTLLDPTTDLEDAVVTDLLRQSFPATELDFINRPGAPGTDDLVSTLLNSAKVASGSAAYDASVSANQSGLKAIEFNIPETLTSGGSFSPSERLDFINSVGGLDDSRSGLSSVTTNRTFEIALIDTNVTLTGIESGDADDFGVIVEVGQVLPGSSVVPGEFVFLSYTGSLEGEDIDTIDAPGINATVAILFDLDNLHDVLGIQTITRLFVVDADVGGSLNVMEALSLNSVGCSNDPDCDDGLFCNGVEHCVNNACEGGTPIDCDDGVACTVDSCDEMNDQCSNVPDDDVCSDGLFCTGIETCVPGTGCVSPGNPCPQPTDCDETNDSCGCSPPFVLAAGPRYLAIEPAPGVSAVAILVRGVGANNACVVEYVSASGALTATAEYRTPAEWGEVLVRGDGVLADSDYEVYSDCDPASPGSVVSAPALVHTWLWADGDNNDGVDVLDFVRVIDGFRGDLLTDTNCTADSDCAFEAPNFQCHIALGLCYRVRISNVDLVGGVGCLPDGIVDVLDIVQHVERFRGMPIPCTGPCSPLSTNAAFSAGSQQRIHARW